MTLANLVPCDKLLRYAEWSTEVVPNLLSVMNPFRDLAETCGPL